MKRTPDAGPMGERSSSWTARAREEMAKRLPMENLLPDRQPYYVGSWVYVFGVVTIAALVLTVLSGIMLALAGPDWWHISGAGRFFNSLHFWSVQVFFVFMVLHLWGQYFMASWRGGRATTWMIGVVIFAISIVAAQYIAMNAKDAVNSTGVGGFFNVLNFGQMYGLHVMLLPIAIIVLVVLHIVQVGMRGVVPPIGQEGKPAVTLELRKQ